MSSNTLDVVAYFLSIRSSLITLSSKELIELIYLDKNGKQNTAGIDSFFNTMSFLLGSEQYYPYLGEDVLNKTYDVLSYGRSIITEDRERLCNFINELILELNSIHSNNYDEKRTEYLAEQLFIRTGETADHYDESLDVIELIIKEYMKCDLVVFESIFGGSDTFVIDDSNVSILISSFSYYCTYLTSILEDEETLKLIAYIKYVLDYANHRQFSEKYISKSVFEKQKKVLKRIQRVIDQKMKDTSLSGKEISKLKIKAKASIN